MLFPCARGRKSSREKILDAAAELVAEIGAGRLTLEAVAERAGLSKGGLLYNFPTKAALLKLCGGQMKETASGMLAATAENPKLLDPLRQVIGETLKTLKETSEDL